MHCLAAHGWLWYRQDFALCIHPPRLGFLSLVVQVLEFKVTGPDHIGWRLTRFRVYASLICFPRFRAAYEIETRLLSSTTSWWSNAYANNYIELWGHPSSAISVCPSLLLWYVNFTILLGFYFSNHYGERRLIPRFASIRHKKLDFIVELHLWVELGVIVCLTFSFRNWIKINFWLMFYTAIVDLNRYIWLWSATTWAPHFTTKFLAFQLS